jgi:hypothetical protein
VRGGKITYDGGGLERGRHSDCAPAGERCRREKQKLSERKIETAGTSRHTENRDTAATPLQKEKSKHGGAKKYDCDRDRKCYSEGELRGSRRRPRYSAEMEKTGHERRRAVGEPKRSHCGALREKRLTLARHLGRAFTHRTKNQLEILQEQKFGPKSKP